METYRTAPVAPSINISTDRKRLNDKPAEYPKNKSRHAVKRDG
jgi:hypothetical protein